MFSTHTTPAKDAVVGTSDKNDDQPFANRRQASRSRTRTRSRNLLRFNEATNVSGGASLDWTRYTSTNHPLSEQNLSKRGYHSFTCFQTLFRVKKRYTLIRELGIGSYGCVALAHDRETDRHVAIKKITRFFGREVLTRRVLREVASLRHLLDCPYIVEVLEFDVSFIEFNEVYLVLFAYDADMFQIIRSNQPLTDSHIKYFMVQLLRAIHYMHSAHIVHRDLKPGNLLVNADCSLCVCDFGMSRAFASDDAEYAKKISSLGVPEEWDAKLQHADPGMRSSFFMKSIDITPARQSTPGTDLSDRHAFMRFIQPNSEEKAKKEELQRFETPIPVYYPGSPLTDYVSTRWYRAPEVMLCCHDGYGPAMDMWSVGCILAELLGRKPVFPGSDYVDQLSRIHKVLGAPSELVMDRIGSERAKVHMESMGHSDGVRWSDMFPDASEESLDLLSRLLQWDPQKRITAGEVLAHPYLRRYREASYSAKLADQFTRFDDVEHIHSPSEFKLAFEAESAAIDALHAMHRGRQDGNACAESCVSVPVENRTSQDKLDNRSEADTANGLVTPLKNDAGESNGALDADVSLVPNSAYDLPSGIDSALLNDSPACVAQKHGVSRTTKRFSDAQQRDQKIQRRGSHTQNTLFNRACAFIGWS